MSTSVEALTAQVLAIASGDLTARIEIEGDDDLAALAVGVEMLAEELAESRRREQAVVDELKATAERLERSNEELQSFAYAASHDLQEPLRKITAFGGRLATAENLSDRHQDYLRRMLGAADRMSSLIDGLLALSRIGRGAVKRKVQPFEPVFLGVVSDLELLIHESGSRVELLESATIDADPLQLRQLTQNLIQNALKFRKPGTGAHVQVSAVDIGGAVQIIVQDDGIGFEPRYAERILRPFERLHGRSSDYAGTGIGLALCRRICSRHDGSLTAEGKPDEGARFCATFPTTPPA